jgi:hypothetical protein
MGVCRLTAGTIGRRTISNVRRVGMGRTVCPYVTYVLHKRKTYVYIRMCVKIGRKTYALAHIRVRVAYVGHTYVQTYVPRPTTSHCSKHQRFRGAYDPSKHRARCLISQTCALARQDEFATSTTKAI